MKVLFVFFLFPFFAQAQNSVEWLVDMNHDYGLLTQFEPATTAFSFKNITTDTIVIDNIRTTCGCTAPDWDYKPIVPGEIRDIKIVFDAGKVGYFRKKIKVFFSNQRKCDVLYIEGEVE